MYWIYKLRLWFDRYDYDAGLYIRNYETEMIARAKLHAKREEQRQWCESRGYK